MATTKTAARRNVAQQLGGYGVFFATSGSTTTAICTAAFKSSNFDTDQLAFAWFYWPSATSPKLARVTAEGLDPSTGTLTLDRPLGQSVSGSTVFEIHTKIPPAREPVEFNGNTWLMGIDECVLEALRHLLVKRTYSLTLVDGQHDYTLPAWLDSEDRLLDVLQPNALGSKKVSAADHGHPWVLRPSTTGLKLHFDIPYRINSGSHALDLEVMSPADTFRNVLGAAWTESAGGVLANESDEVLPDTNAISAVALYYAYGAIAANSYGTDKAEALRLQADQLPLARAAYGYDTRNDIAGGAQPPAEAVAA